LPFASLEKRFLHTSPYSVKLRLRLPISSTVKTAGLLII